MKEKEHFYVSALKGLLKFIKKRQCSNYSKGNMMKSFWEEMFAISQKKFGRLFLI